jgi:ankyrin repeat protein
MDDNKSDFFQIFRIIQQGDYKNLSYHLNTTFKNINLDKTFIFAQKHITLLQLSIEFHEIECTRVLLEHGANPNFINEKCSYICEEFTPLHIAIKRGYFDIVKLLIEYGGNIYLECSGTNPTTSASSGATTSDLLKSFYITPLKLSEKIKSNIEYFTKSHFPILPEKLEEYYNFVNMPKEPLS